MSDMDGLAGWLGKVWDEEAAAAEGNGIIAWLTFREPDGSMRYTAVASGHPDDHWIIDGQEVTGYASARVVYDYRAVLARIAADRQILALDICAACDTEDQPCDHRESTLRLLASAHADRPGYQEAWRP